MIFTKQINLIRSRVEEIEANPATARREAQLLKARVGNVIEEGLKLKTKANKAEVEPVLVMLQDVENLLAEMAAGSDEETLFEDIYENLDSKL